MLTPFGKAVRKWRIDKGVRLKDMADALDVSSAFLSAVETGRKNPTSHLGEKIAAYFGLAGPDKKELETLIQQSRADVKLKLDGLTNGHREAAVALARRFSDFGEDELNKLQDIIRKAEGSKI